MRNLSALLVGSFLVAGCVDPSGEFAAFAQRVAEVPTPDAGPIPDAGGDGAACTVAPGMVEGDYLLALSVSIAPTTPILSSLQVTTPAFNGGTGFAFVAQPLSAADRKTPVGVPFSAGPFAVAADGAFVATVNGLQVTGAANPVTGGDIVADVVLTGNICGSDRFFCGPVTGTVTEPIALDLAKSTFTMTKLDSPTAYPEPPTIDCSGKLADPL
jgi:hypothetical protein